MNISRYLLMFCLAILLGISFSTHAAKVDLAEAVNKAGKQRMLSQRIAKAYFFLGNNVRRDKAKKQLKKSIVEFKKNHTELKAEISNQGVQKMLVFVDIAIEDYVDLVGRPYNQENAAFILDLSETILEASQDIVVKIEALSNVEKPKIVNISGRQRMLSQRIAKYYIAYQAGFHDKDHISQLETAVKEFESALAILKAEKINSPQINAKLATVTRLWQIIRSFFLDIETGGLPVTVFATTDSIMDSMNTVTGLYVKASS
ncbi:MAG: type IV pili methyl-accepting chemotaxis transducer N-terminal domain-containing protein [Candidatus Thiodiazotropha sp. (ex Lucinoma borealis)]|nr:type IV pili methyl-accepting chemotaxis transducer N-terminal domain-containing protein [Candidatus Thiodiazotropha sp. (ex Lucinoma borealis)]